MRLEKYIKLTPEEWVRQNLIQYLYREKGFPLTLMAEYANIQQHEKTCRYCLL